MFNKKELDGLEDFFEFDSLNRNEVLKIFKESKAIIDCPLPNQRGLTMRTFEVLALKRKLITTNKNIKDYEFYTPDNIFIIESDKEIIPMEFINTDFNKNYTLSSKYSLKEFVNKLVEL